ncbi:hypothetical protein [Novosphingobium lindaniclasticum]
MTMPTAGHASPLQSARDFVADYFEALERPDLARMVRAGSGDDFAEMHSATRLLAAQAAKIARYEEALDQYADHGFWDDALPGGPLALHDGGDMARNVLKGRPAFFHRD